MAQTKIKFNGGINIAIKIPKSKYDATVSFYKNIRSFRLLKKKLITRQVSQTHKVEFSNNTLWLDCVDNYTHSETWLELKTPDVKKAAEYLKTKGVDTCDELEEIPEDMHWIMDPAGTVFILCKEEKNDD